RRAIGGSARACPRRPIAGFQQPDDRGGHPDRAGLGGGSAARAAGNESAQRGLMWAPGAAGREVFTGSGQEVRTCFSNRPPQDAAGRMGEGVSPLVSIFMSESFAELFEESFASQHIKPGSIISGTVVAVTEDKVLVSAGLKSEAVIPIEQFKNEKGETTVAVG